MRLLVAIAVTWFIASGTARAHEIRSAEIVEFVLACAQERGGASFELINKCSCQFDRLTEQLIPADFEAMRAAEKAISIAGERGSILRDAEDVHRLVARWRQLSLQTARSCFLPAPLTR
jgi:hypothetical protein